MTDRAVQVSKFLALVLRHDPGRIGLELDGGGWADVDALLAAARRIDITISRAELEAVVRDNPKQRFALDQRGNRIRANQGHSVDVDLGLTAVDPPAVLFHGTTRRVLPAILAEGLRPMSRQHVHLSADAETARVVGSRHGPPVVLTIAAATMAAAGHPFWRSDNGVWLTPNVPREFLSETDAEATA
ncbi:MAG TPA: RNA 2'-phosphotransferase [Acidimicrobiia bacterium]|nr:RNA 2'-phosphotransferase [Acidimicrobiia bacterium]